MSESGANSELQCPLCNSKAVEEFYQQQNRRYFHCINCMIAFLDPNQRLSISEERKQYDLHQNEISDPSYQQFLNRIVAPVRIKIPAPATVLDFGCGPGPALAHMFKQAGYQTAIYDPYYFPNTNVLKVNYQIIALTEVLEHCFHPWDVLLGLSNRLEEGGIIGIMTKRLTDIAQFGEWHYKNDPTHVCFYKQQSFQWIARKLNMKLTLCSDDSLILEKLA